MISRYADRLTPTAVLCLLLVNAPQEIAAADRWNGCEVMCASFVQPERIDYAGAADQSSPTHTISGNVVDVESGENVIGATVYAPDYRIGTTTNQYGFFSLTVDADSIALVYSHVSYAPALLDVRLDGDIRLNVELQPATFGLDEIEVVAQTGDSPVEAVQIMRSGYRWRSFGLCRRFWER